MKVNFKVENDKGDTYEYEVSKFPSGELNVRLKEPSTISTELLVIAIRSSAISDNIMELCLLVNALHNVRELSLSLAIPYVPYSRQDRVCNEGEALSIKVFADIINSLNFANVITIDNHSDVATALLNNCYNAAVSGLLSFTNANSYDFLLSPDAGSIKKVSECSKVLQIPMLRADKMRDTMTGDITGTEVYTSAEQIKNKSIPIVDDIAAGGMSFYYIATLKGNRTYM